MRVDVPDARVRARFDRDRILQVLSNLVRNALQFTWSGGLITLRVIAVAPASRATFGIKQTDVSSPAERQQAERAMEAMRDLRERITHNAPRSMFVLMPVFGLLTWAFYRRAEPYYVPHLYYSIHFHSFVFLMMAVAELCTFGGRIGRVVGGLFPLTILPYHYLALRRVFGGSRLQVAWKGTAIAVLYLVTIAAILIALLVVTIKKVMGS